MRRAFLLSPPRDRAASVDTALSARLEGSARGLMVVATAASAVLLLALGAGLTFFLDEWDLLLHRRGLTLDAFMRPHNEHISVLPAAIYKAMLSVFGMESVAPARVVAVLLLSASAVLLFVYLRRCVGGWLALAGSVIVLFLGAAWEDLLFPSGALAFAGSTACGLGMLLALQREDRRGDALACVLLVLSVAFYSLGLAFAVGAAIDVVLRREHLRRRAYIVAVPLLLYGLWYVGWGHTAETSLSLHNAATTPRFVIESLGSSISALLGLFAFRSGVKESVLGRTLLFGGGVALMAGLAFVTWRMYRVGRSPMSLLRGRSRWLWIVVAIGLTFWILAGLNQMPGRTPSASRYQYPGAIFVLLAAAEALRGVRIGVRAKLMVSALAVAAVGGNLVALSDGRQILLRESDLARGELGGLEIARGTVDPAFRLRPSISPSQYLGRVDARSYFSAVDAFGSPAGEPAELPQRPERARAAADVVLAHALGLALERAPGASGRERSECAVKSASRTELTLPAGGAVLHAGAGGPARVRLRRFATESFPVEAGTLRGGASAVLRIPRDRAGEPWRLAAGGSRAVTICRLVSP